MKEKTTNLTSNEYFQHIIKLNPFDAVVILKKANNEQYIVELTNEKANQLFQTALNNKALANDYFSAYYWKQLITVIESSTKDTQYLQLNNKSTVIKVYAYSFIANEERYFSVIFRQSDVQNKDIEKHLSIVEQNIDPVLSLDMNGTVVYANIAATKTLDEIDDTIIGKNIHDFIVNHYKYEFSHVLQKALHGASTSMPKCVFTERFNMGNAFYLKLHPTYWEGVIIGVHVVLKDTKSFYVDNEALQYLSLIDELTGLLNRSALKEHWKSEFDSITLKKQKLAFLLIDLDRFKKFNESLGEEKGDELIRGFCSRLESFCNMDVRLYRYSGDEFIYIIKNNSREEIEKLAQNILLALKTPFIIDDQEYFITVSIGISLSPTDGSDLETLLRKADQALFHVKEHGRSNYRFYRDGMNHAFPDEALMEAHLRRAIEFNELAIHLQPQMDLVTNRIDSFEALLRWNNRKFGFVSPAQFIPIAEASGLIIEIGDWILEMVCKYQAEWRKRGYRPVRIAVNISPKQFSQENFARKIEALLKKYDVDPEYLEVEITESSMTNINETYSMLTELKRLGVYVSVDDFGTGYSSLSYLKRYPIDIIKIDQSFIADIDKDERNEAIIKAIILLSHNLGLEVVAEGVEEQIQEDFLKAYHCQKVQGYYYNRPLPVEEMVSQYLLN